jgi:DNA-binding SARP family transcriptional activator
VREPGFAFAGERELLLEAGRAKEAMQAFEQSLLRTPKRTPSVLGLARAAAAAGDQTTARAQYQELTTMPGAAPASPAMQEAQKALKTTNNF